MNSYLFRIERPFSKWRVRPFPGEGAFSYFHRLVRDQEDCKPATYADALGLPKSKIGARHLLDALLKLPISEEQKRNLANWTPLPVDGHFILNGTPLHHRIIPLCRQLHCPDCVAEAPFHRAWWDIEGFETCPFHGVLLRRWSGGKFDGNWPPFYGQEKRKLEEFRSETDHDRNSFESYILRRIGYFAPAAPAMPFLDRSSLDDVIWYTGVLGRLLRHPRCDHRPAAATQDYQVGYEALRKDREHLVKALAEWLVANNTSEDLAKGSAHSLGWSSTFAQSKGRRKTFETASLLGREIILAQTLACAQVGSVGFARLGRSEVEIWPISFTRAQTKLGVTSHSAMVIAERVGIQFDVSARHRLVDQNQFLAMQGIAKSTVTAEEAVKDLGCTPTQLRRLAWHKYIHRIKFSGQKEVVYVADDIGQIVERLATLPECQGDGITIDEAARRRQTSEAEIIASFLRGEYKGYRALVGNGFQALRLPATTPYAWTKRGGKPQKIGRKKTVDFAMLRAEFRVMTNLSSETVSALVEHSHLLLVSDSNGCPQLSREAAMAFHKRYVSPRIHLDVPKNELRRRLGELGVPVLFDDICENLIVERSRFEAATGLATMPKHEDSVALWQDLVESFAEHAPSFIVPKEMCASKLVIRTTASKASFSLHIEGGSFHFQKRFDPIAARREWALYCNDPADVRRALDGFRWMETQGGCLFKLTASCRTDLDVAAAALGRFCDIFRQKRRAIRRKKND